MTQMTHKPRMAVDRLVEQIVEMPPFSQRVFTPPDVQQVIEKKVDLTPAALEEALRGIDPATVVIHVKRFADNSVKLSIRSRTLRGSEGEFVVD